MAKRAATTTQTIIGRWNVVEQQWKLQDEWIHEYNFAPGQWTIEFHPNGRMSEDFNVAGHPCGLQTGTWARDVDSGIILFRFDLDPDPDPDDNTLIVFDPSDDGPWLYFVDDAPHIPSDRATLIAHHAHERHKLHRVTY